MQSVNDWRRNRLHDKERRRDWSRNGLRLNACSARRRRSDSEKRRKDSAERRRRDCSERPRSRRPVALKRRKNCVKPQLLQKRWQKLRPWLRKNGKRKARRLRTLAVMTRL